MPNTILHINSSARRTGSVSRDLTAQIIDQMGASQIITRDLADGDVPLLSEDWVAANFTPADSRTDAQKAELAISDRLIAEINASDILVIGVPIYNFGVPAAFKAWVDQVARAGVTFRYTENGPVGLLEGKRAVIALTSGGTEAGSTVDFASGYVRHVLGFIGITDVEIVFADRLVADQDAALSKAKAAIAGLPRVA